MIEVILVGFFTFSSLMCPVGFLEALYNYPTFRRSKRKYFKFLKDFFKYYRELEDESFQRKPPEFTQVLMTRTKEQLIKLEQDLSEIEHKMKRSLRFTVIFGVVSIVLLIIYAVIYRENIIKTIIEIF